MAQPSTNAGAAAPVSVLVLANALACVGLVALVLPQRVGLGTNAIRLGFFALGLAAAAIIAAFARRPVAGASSALRGLAIAAGTISAAFFLGLSGAVFTWGQDGLAFALGLGAGFLLLQLLVGPSFAATGAASVPNFFAKRYGSTASLLAACVVAISMLVLLVAQVSAAALISARLLEVDFGVGVAVAAVALGGCFLLKGRTGPSLITAALFPLMLVAFLAPAVQLSLPWSGMPMPQIAHAQALWQIQGLEETLLDQDLADAAFMKPMLAPFISLSATNVMGVILGLAAGMACLPPALALLRGASAREARWSLVWALALAALFLTAAPALAAYAKYALLSLIGNHTQIAQLPAWMFTYGKLGLLDICGYPAVDAATTVAACATLPDPTAVLRLQDVALQPDMIALATPEMAGLAPAMLGLLAAAAFAAALVTADGPLAAVIEALRGLGRRGSETTGSGKSGYALAVAVVLVAALAAAARSASLLMLATWALTLAGAGLLPALVAGLWWRRANAFGASAALITGFAGCAFYLLGTRYFAVEFFEAFQSLSSAGPTARDTFTELQQAWSAAPVGAAKDAAWAALDAHAQTMANWWGIKSMAAALLALPVGVIALIAGSLATRAKSAAA
jgi:cation/acetate symporter